MTAEIIIALTIYAEAAGEPLTNKYAVASVIWNRADGDVRKLAKVCKAPKQFSCWNRGTPSMPKRDRMSQKAWADCLGFASAMICGRFKPSTPATFYHDISIAPPYWVKGKRLVWAEGLLRFYA